VYGSEGTDIPEYECSKKKKNYLDDIRL